MVEAASAAAQRGRAFKRECLTSASPALDKNTDTASAEAPPPPPEVEEEAETAGEEEDDDEEIEQASASSKASRQLPNSPASSLPVTAALLASRQALAAAACVAGKRPERDKRERSLLA